jgi:hypothetical protein
LTRIHRFDAALPARLTGDLDMVADGGNVADMLPLLEAAAQVAGEHAAIGLHGEKARLRTDDETGD